MLEEKQSDSELCPRQVSILGCVEEIVPRLGMGMTGGGQGGRKEQVEVGRDRPAARGEAADSGMLRSNVGNTSTVREP